MGKKRSAIILLLAVTLGMTGCGMQEQKSDSIEYNRKQIEKGMEKFSQLKNGTIEVEISVESANHAVKSMDNGKNSSLTTFLLDRKGYHFMEERISLDEQTGEVQFSATKQADGKLFISLPMEQPTKERLKPYEWQDVSGNNHNRYEPNSTLKMMITPNFLLSNNEYIKSITREKEGSFTKYILTTNKAYEKYAKDFHRAEENYTVHEHHEIYWVNENGLFMKHQSHDEVQWTIDGIEDTYIFDITAEYTKSDGLVF